MQIIEVAPREWDIKIGVSLAEAAGIVKWLKKAESSPEEDAADAARTISVFYKMLEKLVSDLGEQGING